MVEQSTKIFGTLPPCPVALRRVSKHERRSLALILRDARHAHALYRSRTFLSALLQDEGSGARSGQGWTRRLAECPIGSPVEQNDGGAAPDQHDDNAHELEAGDHRGI